jgi:hypothetical protein
MSAPSLSIPIRANLDAFKKAMNETSSLASTAARKVTQKFLEMNKEFASAAGAAAFNTAGIAALQLAGRVALVVGAAKLMGDAIGAARDQLKEMVDLGNKAQNLGVSSSFLQSARAEAKKLQVDVEDLDGALAHAFEATKDKSPIDLAAWDTGKDRITDVERALRIYNETLAKAAGQQLTGLVLFRDADTQEKKIQAVLLAMIQLDKIGQHTASLDLGEKMFGSAFVDRIRQGRTSAESLLTTIKQASGDADGIFPDALVRRAKEMDDQLKVAHQRLSTALKPSWDDLADVLLTIKGYWADTVGLIAKAVELSNNIHIPGFSSTNLEQKRAELDQVNAAINGTGGGIYGSIKLPSITIPGIGKVTNSTQENMEAYRDQLQREIAQMAKGDQYGPNLPGTSRGTGDKPTLKPTGSDTDKFDTSADAITKRTAALQAEAAALDLGTEARDRAKIAAQLETVAKQANAAAGKGANVVTAEQRKVIDEVSDAYGKAAVAMEKAKVASQIKFNKDTAFLTPEDVAIASQLKGIYPDVATALGSVEAAGIRAANGMKELSSVGQDVNRGLFVEFGQNLRAGQSAWDAFKNAGVSALGKIADKLMSIAADNLWKAAFGGIGGGGSGLLGLLGIGGGSSGGVAGTISVGSQVFPAFGAHAGVGPGDPPTFTRNMPASTFRNAPRFHSGVGPGERAAIIRTDESVLTPGQMRALGPAGGGVTVTQGDTHITVQGNADETTLALMKQELAKRDAEFHSKVVGAVTTARQRRQLA